jgi:hypothetical protein
VFYAGLNDRVVSSLAVREGYEILTDYLKVNDDNIRTVRLSGANHTFPTDNFGEQCSKSISPFISNCHYDLSYVAIDFMMYYQAKYPIKYDNNRFFTYAQSSVASMSTFGYAYVPAECEKTKC